MNITKKSFPRPGGAVVLMGGNLGGAFLILLRNLLIARMISVEDFGIASTFAIAVTLIETGTNLGIDRMIVQDRRGGQRSFQSALHTIQILRGCIGAVAMLALANGYAHIMGVPQLGWAYQCLALIPLIRGFLHLDIFRAQRQMQFQQFALVTVLSNVLAVLAAFPLAIWLQDFRVMLCAVLVQQSAFVLISHLVASSRYGLGWNTSVFSDALRFGLPLLLNGLVVFATLNGDQVLIGSFLGMEVLGWFAVAFSLTLVPATIAANTSQSLLLPRLARIRQDHAAFAERAGVTLGVTFVLAISLALVLAVIGPFAVEVLFGARYAQAAEILPLLALLQGIRVAKAGPAIIAIARADTRDPLFANLARLAFLPAAVIVLGAGGDVPSLIFVAIAGESAALVVALALLMRRGSLHFPKWPLAVRHG